MVLIIKFLLLACQSEEEASSAGEQLASNKIDGYTVQVSLMAKKNSKPKAFQMQEPKDK